MSLTDKQKRFCEEYVIDFNATQAAIRAGYSVNTAQQIGSENLLKPVIQKYLSELKKDISERNKITVDECVSLLADMARFDIADLYDENQNLKSIHDIPESARKSIAELNIFEEFTKKGDFIGFTKKIKTTDRKGAIIELMKHLGGYERDNKQKSQGGVTIFQLPNNNR